MAVEFPSHATNGGSAPRRTIVVPTDGSEKDGRALAVAADFAALADAHLQLVRVLEPAAQQAQSLGAIAVLEGVYPSRELAEEDLRRQAATLHLGTPDRVATSVIEAPSPAEAILSAADQHDALAIVMATRSPSTLDRLVRGSVGDRVVRTSERPVVLVPPGADDMKGRQLNLRRILVPLDGSRASLQVIETLQSLPRASEMELVLMHVTQRERTGGLPVPPVDQATLANPNPEWIHVQADQAQGHLEEIATRLRARGIRATTRVLESAQPARTIVEAVRGELVSAIAMTTRGAGGARRMAHGSTATTVVQKSEVPVMLVRAA